MFSWTLVPGIGAHGAPRSPCFRQPPSIRKVLLVNLTREQIENSPSIETHKPVSRQFEEEYYQYYGFPSYWHGDAMRGMHCFPEIPSPPYPLQDTKASVSGRPHYGDDPHLRSTQAVSGYGIQASDGAIGYVTDFMMDDKSWAIRHLVVETGHWFSGKEVLISPSKIDRISYVDSKVFVNLTKEAIRKAPEYDVFPVGTRATCQPSASTASSICRRART